MEQVQITNYEDAVDFSIAYFTEVEEFINDDKSLAMAEHLAALAFGYELKEIRMLFDSWGLVSWHWSDFYTCGRTLH